VHFTRDVLAPTNAVLADALAAREPARRHRLLAVVDEGVASTRPTIVGELSAYAEAHAARMQLVDPPRVVAGGEDAKNDPALVASLLRWLHDGGIDRHSFLVIVGGGALLDVAGYAAATAHRGVRVVRVPTTVLAQADSGVGVKNGVNAFGKKNFLGTFAPPFAVLNDARFLETLPRRDRVAGMAEAVKVALLRDAGFFEWLCEHAPALATGDLALLETLVRRTAELHLAHIATSGDPFEMGSARPLDFGHWAAHKLETMTGNRLRHGEAVAIGLAIDTLYSAAVGLCDRATAEVIVGTLGRLGFRLWDEALDVLGADGRPVVLEGLQEFQEHLGGDLTITLLERIGRGVEVHEVRPDLVRQAIARLRGHRVAA
jgi:3-dehydroquinate synthase